VTASGVDDARLMQRALALARQGLAAGAMPIAAVLARQGDVLAESFWRGAEHGLLNHPDSVVLREVDQRIDFRARREATLYLTLEPCLMCMGAAMSFFLGRIVYAMPARADGAAAVAEVWAPAAGHPLAGGSYAVPLVEGGLYEAEARQLVAEWLEGGATGAEADFARHLLPS
jgi:tRNA(adenine34) deaminase